MCSLTPLLERHLDSGVAAPGQARALLREWACRSHTANCIDDAMLALSEVVTNAVTHAGPPIALSFECRAGTLHIAVHDGDPDADIGWDRPHSSPPVVTGPAADDISEHGRGLPILDLLAPGWEVERDPTGKTVSFALDCTSS